MNHSIKDIDDVDDDLFVSKKPQNYIFADKKAADITERTTKILANTRSIVQESEQIGQSTLENLASQRETLERVENDLDHINAMTRATQKNLNNMRSFFGGIKSLFGYGGSASANQAALCNSKLTPSSSFVGSSTSTPASSMVRGTSSGNISKSTVVDKQVPLKTSPLLTQPEEKPVDEFDANLSEIGFGLGRLKEMAMKLGDEIGDQNVMLDRITDKSERAGDSVKHQNRQIQQLLKK